MTKEKKRGTAAYSEDLPVVKRQTGSAAFDPDYTYVAENLKKIGILAACFIAVLVVLYFILGTEMTGTGSLPVPCDPVRIP